MQEAIPGSQEYPERGVPEVSGVQFTGETIEEVRLAVNNEELRVMNVALVGEDEAPDTIH